MPSMLQKVSEATKTYRCPECSYNVVNVTHWVSDDEEYVDWTCLGCDHSERLSLSDNLMRIVEIQMNNRFHVSEVDKICGTLNEAFGDLTYVVWQGLKLSMETKEYSIQIIKKDV